MNLKQLEFKYNLRKCHKLNDKKQLERTYNNAVSLDITGFDNRITFIDECNSILKEMDHKNYEAFTNRVYGLVIKNNELLDYVIELLDNSRNFNLLFRILEDSSIKKSEQNIKTIVSRLYKVYALDVNKEIYLVNNYRKYVDISWIEDFICHFNDAHYIYTFCKNVECHDLKKLENTLLSTNDIEYIYKFLFIKNVDVSILEDYILSSGNNKYVLKLLDVPQIDNDKIEKYILNSNDSKMIFDYLINYNCNFEFIMKLVDLHNYELLYKLKSSIILSKEISDLIDIELMKSNNELYICSVIINDIDSINNLFGNVNNMLIYLCNKYREEKNVKWIKLYDQLKSKTDTSIFNSYYEYIKKIKTN